VDGPVVAAVPGMVGTAVEDATTGATNVEFPAIDRMLAHFQNASIAQEVGMSAAFAFVPSPFGIAVSAFGIISTMFHLYDAVEEFTSYLDHMTSDGDASTWNPPGAATRGDPHHRSFSGTRYSFMAVGEFVVARTDGLEVQTRTVPVGDSGSLSLNERAAIAVGDDVVEVVARDRHVTVNGEVVSFSELTVDPRQLDGGVVEYRLGRLLVRTDDGHVVNVRCGADCAFVDVWITPDELGGGGFEGLSGTTRVRPARTCVTATGRSGARWASRRSTAAGPTSGVSRCAGVAVHLRGGRGHRHLHLAGLPHRGDSRSRTCRPGLAAWAEAACRASGLGDHDPVGLAECTLDFAVTGDPCFLRSAQGLGTDFSMIGTDEEDGWQPEDPTEPEDPIDPDDPEDPIDPDDPEDPR
jgi:hypothetical protein